MSIFISSSQLGSSLVKVQLPMRICPPLAAPAMRAVLLSSGPKYSARPVRLHGFRSTTSPVRTQRVRRVRVSVRVSE
eukprot:1192180-Prorocentrum_minimum.AAC.7